MGRRVIKMDVKGRRKQSTNEEVERIDGRKLKAERPDCRWITR